MPAQQGPPCSAIQTAPNARASLPTAALPTPSPSRPNRPQDEVGELKRRLAVTAHQADQLKGEVAVRDGQLQREKYDKAKVGGLVVFTLCAPR